MKAYNYYIYFYKNNDKRFRCIIHQRILASSNKEALIRARKLFEERRKNDERLKDIEIIKETCRAYETKPRARKMTPLQRALNAVNKYLLENK
ncbi:MAG: hypothetical protein MSS80_07015 [Mollicutes bacterium]|nr:hypothetical protein [Mollicutes bacterium]